jgi:hypothetical protein
MFKTFAIVAFAAIALSGCMQNGVNANCAALGVAGGAALGAVTENDLATSALAGGVAGALAGDAGLCR